MKEHFNTKYPIELRKQIYEYFKTHTARETAEKFKLNHGQVIGILETGRRKNQISEKFKDKRNKTPWTFEQDLKMIQCCGLIERKDIAKKINRTSVSLDRKGWGIIKERLSNHFNARSKYLHGAPYTWVQICFGDHYRDLAIRTKAGPTKTFKLFIIPWVDMIHIAESTNYIYKNAFYALANFQYFIYGCRTESQVRAKIKEIINEKRNK